MLKINRDLIMRDDLHAPVHRQLPSVSDVLRVFRVRRTLVASIALASVAVALIYCLAADRIFQASTTLLLDFRQEDPMQKNRTTPDAQIETAAIESQVQLMTADTVATAVVRRLHLADDPEFVGDDRWAVTRAMRGVIDWATSAGGGSGEAQNLERIATDRLVGIIKAARVGRTYLVRVDALSQDPDKAARIANTVAQAFMDDQLGARLTAADRSADWMRKRSDELRRQSLDADRAVQNYTSRADRERVELRSLETTAQTYRALFESFLNQYTTIVQQQSFPISFARIVSPATPPQRKAFPRTTLILLGAMIGGLGLGWLAGFALESFRRTLSSEDDVEELTGLTAIGSLPRIEHKRRGLIGRMQVAVVRLLPSRLGAAAIGARLVGQADPLLQVARLYPHSRFSQTINSVRATMALADDTRDVKVVGIVSAQAGDGKTVVAANLAQHLAMTGSRTVLIDWNFDKPTLTRATLGTGPSADARTQELPTVIDASSKLAFLPVLPHYRGMSPSAILTDRSVKKIIEHLRERYDHVVIDLPCLPSAVDVRALAALVDCCVLVCSADKLQAPPLVRMLNVWRGVGIATPILGFVLNRSPRTNKLEGHAGMTVDRTQLRPVPAGAIA